MAENALTRGLQPYVEKDSWTPDDYAGIGRVVTSVPIHLRRRHDLVQYETGDGEPHVAWERRGRRMDAGATRTPDVYTLEVLESRPPEGINADLYVFGSDEFVRGGLARVVHARDADRKTAMDFLRQARDDNVVTRSGNIARRDPSKRVRTEFRRDVLSILDDPYAE